jgi:hypothetical protein
MDQDGASFVPCQGKTFEGLKAEHAHEKIINVESALEVLMEEKFLLLAGFLQARTAIWFLERRPRVAYGSCLRSSSYS